MPLMTGGEALIESIRSCGIDTAFGIPGIHSIAIYDPLISTKGIRHYTVRHEQSAVYMADGYYRVSGKIAAVFLTTGPGATNSLTGVVEAWGSSIPVLIIASQIDSALIGKGKGALHEIKDQLGMFEPATRWAARINRVEEIPSMVARAVRIMRGERPGPVVLELPVNVTYKQGNVDIEEVRGIVPPAASNDEVGKAADLILNSSCPMIFAGAGIFHSDAVSELKELAELLGAPVFTSVKGKGALPDSHPLSMGSMGSEEPAQRIMRRCDLGIIIGARMSDRSTATWTYPLPEKLIHIDTDPEMIGKNYPTTVGVVGDAKASMKELLAVIKDSSKGGPWNPLEEIAGAKKEIMETWQKVGPLEIEYMDSIREAMGGAVTVFDQTMVSYWARKFYRVDEPRSFLYAMGSGTLGFALPAALGARIGRPKKDIVAITGDGGFMFTCQDLATAAQYNLAVPLVIFNDEKYNMIQWLQDMKFGRHGEIDLVNPDLMKFAESFRIPGIRVNTPDGLRRALKEAVASGKPALIEVQASLKPPLLSIPKV